MLDNSITYTAKSKLLDIINNQQCIGLKLEMSKGLLISIVPITSICDSLKNSVMISKTPMLFIDANDIPKMEKMLVNFDYATEEFIIGNKNVISS